MNNKVSGLESRFKRISMRRTVVCGNMEEASGIVSQFGGMGFSRE